MKTLLSSSLVSCGIAAMVAAVLAAPVSAFTPRSGNAVEIAAPLSDDLYAAGGTVTVSAAVDGDVVAVGGTIDLGGSVTGGVLAAGGTVRVEGPVGRGIRAAGGTLAVVGRIGADVVLAGGAVSIDRRAHIGRDLVANGGTVTVSGEVQRNTLINGGDVTIGGTLRGDTAVRARSLVLLPTARISGKLRYASEQPIDIQPGAEISGGTERLPGAPRPRRVEHLGAKLWLAAHFVEMLALIALGAVVFAVAPAGSAAVAGEVGRRFGWNLLIGFVLLVVVPAAAFLVLFTVVGVPISAVMMLLYFATLYPGQVFVAEWLGERIAGSVSRHRERRFSVYWSLVIGTIVLVVLFVIPVLGWVVRFLVVLVGFGALWAVVWRALAQRPSSSGGLPTAV